LDVGEQAPLTLLIWKRKKKGRENTVMEKNENRNKKHKGKNDQNNHIFVLNSVWLELRKGRVDATDGGWK
jgi:hypothetical protein